MSTAMTTPLIYDLIGRMMKNNRAAHVQFIARFLVQFLT